MPQSASGTASITRLTSILRPFHGGVLAPGYTMSCLPGRLAPRSTTTVTFTGVSTRWLTSPPSLTSSGVAGVNNDSPIVIDDTHFTVRVITGTATGTLTWTDATYSTTTTEKVGRQHYSLVFRRRR